MARPLAELPKGSRITDYMSLGVIAKTFPASKISSILAETGRGSIRQRDLPAHVVIYFVIALALYMQSSYREVLRCLLEGIEWLKDPSAHIKVTGKSGISQARTRLGPEPMKRLYEDVVRPIALKSTPGAWYRRWLLVSLDGSSLDVADERANEKAFGRPGSSRGRSAFPQIRVVSLLECGTHVLFGARMGSYATGEIPLARQVLPRLEKGMLCLADRHFFGFELWRQAQDREADLLWRVKKNARLDCKKRLSDGSYLSRVYPTLKDRRHEQNYRPVRVIEYQLKGVAKSEPVYRLITTILDPDLAPADELAALYQERWEIENALGELKTHLKGRGIVLRSKTPGLVEQEFYGFMLAHFAIRKLMHEAALKANEDPDRLSFLHSVRVIRRKLPIFNATPPSAQGRLE